MSKRFDKPFPRRQILDSSKLKDFEDKFYRNGTKLSKGVENTVEKGEIARYKQFLLFPQCFLKTYTIQTCRARLVWERVKNKTIPCHTFYGSFVHGWVLFSC